jgi:molybdopterin-guanine dinucleotide biosynthesis protein MobB
MPRVFSFIAWSGTGKTTYLEGLIAALKARMLRVAAVKHDGHRLELDREGKDSWRFARAGADVVAVADAEKCAVMDYRPHSLSDILASIRDVDIVLIEGWHAEAERPILLYRAATGKPPKLPYAECFAVVSDEKPDTCPVPCFPLDEPEALADFLLAQDA